MNYVPDLYDFLAELSRNNTREWFHAHRDKYEQLRSLWEDDIQRLINDMSSWEPRLKYQTPKTTAYRIYRDTRFSLDKTPLKTFFSAAFSHYGKSTHRAAYYLQMGPSLSDSMESGLYGGMWCPDTPMLQKVRKAIIDNIEEFEGIISDSRLCRFYPKWVGQQLKTVPKGYDRNHPQAALLRLKDYGRFCQCDMEFFSDPDWPLAVSERFSLLQPLVEFLNYSIDEE